MTSVPQTEAQLQVASRVTPADVEANIVNTFYFTAEDGIVGMHARPEMQRNDATVVHSSMPNALSLLTFCVLILRNGHRVVGINYGSIDPTLFKLEMARDEARKDAVNQVWSLMGYELRSRLAEAVAGR